MKVNRVDRFVLDPTPAQEQRLRSHADTARYAWKGAWINARNAPRREEVGVRGRPAPALEQGKAAYPQAGLVEGELQVRKEAFRTLERALRDLIAPRRVNGKALVSGSPGARGRGDAGIPSASAPG
jgi:hypothetical protein